MIKFKALGAALAATLAFGLGASASAHVVRIKQGALAGVVAGRVESFKGIPFAAPPVGERRWRPPGPAPSWKGVKKAGKFGPICVQPQRPGGTAQAMSEDCLTLNIWRPARARPGARLPVMVWIYGGAFIIGSASTPTYDGTHFAEDGVILVTANYRLGRFGFFAHPALDGGKGPVGNYGLMDQIAALKWVKANIAAFGGNPRNVTVFGESAGAISVNYLMVSPAAKGLFAKAVSESGFGRSKPRPLTGADSAEALGQAFAEGHGVKGGDAAAAKALRALPADVVAANVGGVGVPGSPAPIGDGKIITQGIAEGFAKGAEAHVPYMTGGNSYEASLFERMVSAHPDALIARYGDTATVKAAYGDGDDLTVARALETDMLITEPDRFLGRQMAAQRLPAFVYRFSYVPEASRASAPGARHGGEIGYVFETLPEKPVSFGSFSMAAATPDDRKISAAMHAYWVAFAKTGNPGAAGGPRWPRVSVGGGEAIEFGADGVSVRPDFRKAQLDLIEAAADRASAAK